MDDITSGLLADVTMTMVILAAGHGQTDSGLLCDVTKQGHHIQVTTDITVTMVTLAANMNVLHRFHSLTP